MQVNRDSSFWASLSSSYTSFLWIDDYGDREIPLDGDHALYELDGECWEGMANHVSAMSVLERQLFEDGYDGDKISVSRLDYNDGLSYWQRPEYLCGRIPALSLENATRLIEAWKVLSPTWTMIEKFIVWVKKGGVRKAVEYFEFLADELNAVTVMDEPDESQEDEPVATPQAWKSIPLHGGEIDDPVFDDGDVLANLISKIIRSATTPKRLNLARFAPVPASYDEQCYSQDVWALASHRSGGMIGFTHHPKLNDLTAWDELASESPSVFNKVRQMFNAKMKDLKSLPWLRTSGQNGWYWYQPGIYGVIVNKLIDDIQGIEPIRFQEFWTLASYRSGGMIGENFCPTLIEQTRYQIDALNKIGKEIHYRSSKMPSKQVTTVYAWYYAKKRAIYAPLAKLGIRKAVYEVIRKINECSGPRLLTYYGFRLKGWCRDPLEEDLVWGAYHKRKKELS